MKTDLAKYQPSIVHISMNAKVIFHSLRWPTGVVCPYCGERHIWRYSNGTYKCSHCKKRFTDLTGTPMRYSKIPIEYWVITKYLMMMEQGVSSQEISQLLQITQCSAWYMMHKIRIAFSQDDIKLTGDIAVDEVYLGGKWSSIIIPKKIDILKRYGLWYEGDKKRTWHKKNIQAAISLYKQPVYGMNDGNRIVLQALPNQFNSTDLLNITRRHSDDNLKHLISDQAKYYSDISSKGIDVIQMNHSKGEFKMDGFSSNRIEGTFSHLKRRYRHSYVRPNKKYIQLYLNEFAFRWNHRNDDVMTRLAAGMSKFIACGPITRKDVDLYNWGAKFPKRDYKKKERIEDWFEIPIDWTVVKAIKVQGVEYSKEEFENLKTAWEFHRLIDDLIRDIQAYKHTGILARNHIGT